MAEEDAKGQEPSDELSQADEALDSALEEAGYTPNADVNDEAADLAEAPSPEEWIDEIKELSDEAKDEQLAEGSDEEDVVDAPSGEELGDDDLPSPAPFEVDDEDAEELDEAVGDGSSEDDVTIDDPEQLEEAEEDAVEAADTKPVAKKSRPVKKSKTEDDVLEGTGSVKTETVGSKKSHSTPTRAKAQAQDAPKKVGLGTFVGQVIQELKKVVWPSGAQMRQYFIVVLVFVLFMIAFIGLLDLLFGWLTLMWFG